LEKKICTSRRGSMEKGGLDIGYRLSKKGNREREGPSTKITVKERECLRERHLC